MKRLSIKRTPYQTSAGASMNCANCSGGSCNGGGGGGCHIRPIKRT